MDALGNCERLFFQKHMRICTPSQLEHSYIRTGIIILLAGHFARVLQPSGGCVQIKGNSRTSYALLHYAPLLELAPVPALCTTFQFPWPNSSHGLALSNQKEVNSPIAFMAASRPGAFSKWSCACKRMLFFFEHRNARFVKLVFTTPMLPSAMFEEARVDK